MRVHCTFEMRHNYSSKVTLQHTNKKGTFSFVWLDDLFALKSIAYFNVNYKTYFVGGEGGLGQSYIMHNYYFFKCKCDVAHKPLIIDLLNEISKGGSDV